MYSREQDGVEPDHTPVLLDPVYVQVLRADPLNSCPVPQLQHNNHLVKTEALSKQKPRHTGQRTPHKGHEANHGTHLWTGVFTHYTWNRKSDFAS